MSKKRKSSKNPNIGPRTASARKAVILMNRLRHRPKSVIIQTDTEVVVQVRGDYEHLIKKLKKVFKSKGKDESGGVLRTHAWKLRGLGLMNVYKNERNDFMSVRFFNNPELGVRRPKEVEVPEPSEAEKLTMGITVPAVSSAKSVQGTDLEELDLEAIDITG